MPNSGVLNHQADTNGLSAISNESRPIAFLYGKPIRIGDLLPSLIEIAGIEALGEAVLDRQLQLKAEERSISITEGDIQKERELLLSTLSQDANEAIRLLDELRQRQRLGNVRFRSLLKRNALLRVLIQEEIGITDAEVARTFEYIHGEKRQARIIITSRITDADVALKQLQEGKSFSALAVDVSTDTSASRGGLLPLISNVDPTWPLVLREELWKLQVNQISRPLMIDGDFAIILLEKIFVKDNVYFEDAKVEMQELTRSNQERLHMQQLADQLITDARITIVDESLKKAWEERGKN